MPTHLNVTSTTASCSVSFSHTHISQVQQSRFRDSRWGGNFHNQCKNALGFVSLWSRQDSRKLVCHLCFKFWGRLQYWPLIRCAGLLNQTVVVITARVNFHLQCFKSIPMKLRAWSRPFAEISCDTDQCWHPLSWLVHSADFDSLDCDCAALLLMDCWRENNPLQAIYLVMYILDITLPEC